MNLFQLIALPLVGLFFFRNISRIARGSTQSRGVTIIGTTIWLAAGIAILFPEKTHEIAWLLGIGRGADLVLYVLVISFLLSIFYIYNRFQKLESSITLIIRQLAIREGLRHRPQDDPDIKAEKRQIGGEVKSVSPDKGSRKSLRN